MQGWSWMAALTLVASMAGGLAPTTRAAGPPAVKQRVSLSLRLDGLSTEGGEVEIKPGHAGCKFETIKFQTKERPPGSDGKINLDPIEVETVSAGRECSFAITLREPGQPDKTVRRTLRLTPATQSKAPTSQAMTCYISSNSLNPPVASKPADEAKRKK